MAAINGMAEFDQMVSNNKIVLVDFFATWCGPCQMMAPVVEEIEDEYKDSKDVKIVTVDIDANPDIASKFDVMSVPTFMIFKDGKTEFSLPGAMPKEALLSKIKEISQS